MKTREGFEWWLDENVCISACITENPGEVRVGWAIRNPKEKTHNKKLARTIARGRRCSERALIVNITEGEKLIDAVRREMEELWDGFPQGMTKDRLRSFSACHKLSMRVVDMLFF